MDAVTVVSGLPRSGTSMMMQMLAAGGMPVLTDGARVADEDNPRGYWELERAKALRRDKTWVEQARGRAVKVVSALLEELPAGYRYQVIFMQRRLDEVLASQRAMLARRGEAAAAQVDQQEMAAGFARHLRQVRAWLAQQPHVDVLYAWYHEVIADPVGQAGRVAGFLRGRVDAAAMAQACDPTLWRQRGGGG